MQPDEEAQDLYVGFRVPRNNDRPYVARVCSDCGGECWVNAARTQIIDRIKLVCDGCMGKYLPNAASVQPGSALDGQSV